MTHHLRRSQRLSQQYANNTIASPAFPASSSAYSSANSSPTTDPSSIAAHEDQLRLQLQSQFLGLPPHSSGPLPSPLARDTTSFFNLSLPESALPMSQSGQHLNAMSQHGHPAQAGLQLSQPTANQHHNSFSSTQRPDMTQNSQSQSGAPPPGFLAEAAKRAQMACLMRDLGDVTL